MKIIGVVPARMAASRFPGKPLHKILGRPMLEHVFLRAQMYQHWSTLVVATCDSEIQQFSHERNYPVVMTGSHHTRALDRVAEAVSLLDIEVEDGDVVVCVQGDEPMLRPDMIDVVVKPLLDDCKKMATVLAMHITEESIWLNPDTVKIIHNNDGEVLYTSRAPIPYCKGKFTPDLQARRIYGIFAFRYGFLKDFTNRPETRLEQIEACDSNRILDMKVRQYIAKYPSIESFSVDSPQDILLVEKTLQSDQLFKLYGDSNY